MTTDDVRSLKLAQAMREYETHWMRLNAAFEEARCFGPVDAACFQRLTDAEVKTVDQLLFRFGKLENAMGTRLFSAVLQSLGEWQDDEPFIDRLNRLEKLRIIDRAETWLGLRELRNQSAHAYPDQPEVNAAILMRVLAAAVTLGALLAGIRNYLRRRAS